MSKAFMQLLGPSSNLPDLESPFDTELRTRRPDVLVRLIYIALTFRPFFSFHPNSPAVRRHHIRINNSFKHVLIYLKKKIKYFTRQVRLFSMS